MQIKEAFHWAGGIQNGFMSRGISPERGRDSQIKGERAF